MKTKWHLCVLWSVLSLGLLSCAVDTYESQFTTRKRVFKLGTPGSESVKQSRTKSPQRSPASSSSQRPYPPRSMRPEEKNIQSHFAYLPDVSVTCSTSDFVVRVKPAFYGLGADKEELKLGSSCRSNGVLRPYGDLLFTYPLTACDAVRQTPRGYLLYKFVLHYEPSPKRFPSRAHRIKVDVECRYQRNHHVYQLTVKPTWKTAVVRKKLKGGPSDFKMELMDDSWSRPVKSQVYQLGKTVNLQVSAPHLSTGGKLYINSCYAAPSSGSKSPLKYTIIDNFGCMLDSKSDPGASRFISRTDTTLRFSLKAFQFTADPDTEVNVHCKLFVTPEDAGPAHKSCTYRGNSWKALTGDDSICGCCDSHCVTSTARSAVMKGSASSGSLLVSDQPYTPEEDGFLPVSMSRGEATINPYVNEQQRQENLWGSADVVKYDDDEEEEQDYADEEEEEEEEEQLEEEPDLDELRVLVKEDSTLSEEEGSGYVVQEESEEEDEEEEEEGFEEAEDEVHLNQKEAEVLRHRSQVEEMLQSEVGLQSEPLVSKAEEENRKYTDGGEEDNWMIGGGEVEWKNDEDLVDDGEMTWYFTWR